MSIYVLCNIYYTMHGPCLFNIMPMSIRNLKDCSVHMKGQLDKFLATILDEPQIHGYTAQLKES